MDCVRVAGVSFLYACLSCAVHVSVCVFVYRRVLHLIQRDSLLQVPESRFVSKNICNCYFPFSLTSKGRPMLRHLIMVLKKTALDQQRNDQRAKIF